MYFYILFYLRNKIALNFLGRIYNWRSIEMGVAFRCFLFLAEGHSLCVSLSCLINSEREDETFVVRTEEGEEEKERGVAREWKRRVENLTIHSDLLLLVCPYSPWFHPTDMKSRRKQPDGPSAWYSSTPNSKSQSGKAQRVILRCCWNCGGETDVTRYGT